MQSDALTVDEYLASLPADRCEALQAVRAVVLAQLPEGYEEVMNWGMITYQVPLEVEPNTYNGKPLMYAALASQKRHLALYLTSVYMEPDGGESFRQAYRAAGKPLDMGKSCVRFRSADDLPLDLIGDTIASMPLPEFVERVGRSRR